MSGEVSIVLAFAAGLLSFLSPCVFPLIPSYLFFIGAAGLAPDGSAGISGGRGRVILRTLFFILGFSAVFIIMSIVFSSLVILTGAARYIDIAAGIIIIILGFNVLFDFLKFLNYEKRFHIKSCPRGWTGSLLAGAAFGAGWTPCVGPILGSILLLAGRTGKLGLGVLYLGVYSLGLGLPFLAAAVFFDFFLAGAAKIRRHLPLIQRICGILLIITGILILSGRFHALNILLQKGQYRFIVWAEDRGPIAGLIARWLSLLQNW
jgi:cytochrome c-type biogenesis protein